MKRLPLISGMRRRERRWDAGPALGTGPVLCVALCALGLYGCSAAAAHGDVTGGAQAAVSPEQCLNGGAIQAAATAAAAQQPADSHAYHIQPGDQLDIGFYLDPEFNDQVTVGPDGKIALRMVGPVQAAGMTPAQLAAQIDKDYLSELRSPDAVVNVKNMPGRQVYVEGEVNHPGAFLLQPGMTALQAIAEAGGVTPDASDNDAVLIRHDACGRPAGARVDLASAVDSPGNGEDAALMPYDILVVPRSGIANVDLFVKHYITGLLPFPPYMTFAGPPL